MCFNDHFFFVLLLKSEISRSKHLKVLSIEAVTPMVIIKCILNHLCLVMNSVGDSTESTGPTWLSYAHATVRKAVGGRKVLHHSFQHQLLGILTLPLPDFK